ncbi:hypothetical protein KJS94_11685 [Flavihumibacter rivuli]|uniref:hypothetical protein n=1 Tax=Flavihumibacter rivuli TaxID=2838156 RepID=UPI001EFBE517|nr:hypothetical protein [Flavihumibacter rivuli]ULQ55303.1 hypothetical protein KJS94_11685 [Flavihumibacter rivuli]
MLLPNRGVAMLSSVLGSERAIETNILIIRTFVMLRSYQMHVEDLQQKLREL